MSSANHGLLSVNRRQLIGLGALGAAALALPGRRALGADPLKIAGVFGTPIEEPWVNQIHVALLKAKTDLGVEYIWSENVKAADFGRVLREYAQKGANLVMGDAFTDEEASRRAAKAYPKVAFVMGSGIGPADPNFGVFDNWIHEPAYLSGMIAGKLHQVEHHRRRRRHGDPGGEPAGQCLLRRRQGGRTRTSRCKFSFIGSFFDPPKAKEAALAQIEAGVDVVYAERFGVIEAAHDKGIIAFSNMSDQSAIAPETVVTGPVWDMWPTVNHVVKLVRADVEIAQDFGGYSYMGKGGSYLAPYHVWESKLLAGDQGYGRQAHPADHGRQLPRRCRRGGAGLRLGSAATDPLPLRRERAQCPISSSCSISLAAGHRLILIARNCHSGGSCRAPSFLPCGASARASARFGLPTTSISRSMPAMCWGCWARTAPARPR